MVAQHPQGSETGWSAGPLLRQKGRTELTPRGISLCGWAQVDGPFKIGKSGACYPSAERLQALIVVLLESNGLRIGAWQWSVALRPRGATGGQRRLVGTGWCRYGILRLRLRVAGDETTRPWETVSGRLLATLQGTTAATPPNGGAAAGCVGRSHQPRSGRGTLGGRPAAGE